MSGRPGELTGRVARELATERHERLVELVDAVTIRRALSGCPSVLEAMTDLERELVVAIADIDGLDREITARGLGISKGALEWTITRRRRRVEALTRDLWAASALRPAAELIAAVGAGDAGAVASLLRPLDPQRFAALAVVLAAAVADPDVLTGIPMPDDAAP